MPAPTAFVFAVVTILRLYDVLRSIAWIRQHHAGFIALVDRLEERDRRDADSYPSIYDQTGGSFFPFGVKSYRLRRFVRSGSPVSRILKLPLQALRMLWKLYIYIPVSSGALLMLASLPRQMSPGTTWMIYVVGLLLCACSISIAAEGVVAQKSLGDWARHHYYFKNGGLAKWKIWTGSGLLAWGTATSFLMFTSSRLGGFPQIPGSGAWYNHLFGSAFYGLGSLGLFGSPEASLPAAKVALVAVWLAGIALLIILLAELPGSGPVKSEYLSPAPPSSVEVPPEPPVLRGGRQGVVIVILFGSLWIIWKVLRYLLSAGRGNQQSTTAGVQMFSHRH